MAFPGYLPSRSPSGHERNNYDPAYERDRRAIDLKLKGTFERIFEKYAKDFSNVGDEIDMETGHVVVDNGHLAYMQHERDTGKSASSCFVRAFAEELEVERDQGEDDEDDEGDGDDEDNDDGEEEDEEEDDDDDEEGEEGGDEQSPDELEIPDDDPDELTLDPALAQNSSPTHRASSPSVGQRGADTEQQQHHLNTCVIPSTEINHAMPPISIADSLNALMPHQDASGQINPAAIHALGQSIANQIAQFLVRATTSNSQPQGVWSAPPLPQDAFAPPAPFNNPRRNSTPQPARLPSVFDSPAAGRSLWAPSGSRRKRRRLLQHPAAEKGPEHDGHLDDVALMHRAASRNYYSREEDDLIKRLRDVNGLSWGQITTYMPGRSAGGLSGRYTRVLKDRPLIVKREVIEILDGDDDIPATPTSSIPGNVPGSGPEDFARPLLNMPLLRQALDNQVACQGDTGDTPITIDGEDTDSQRESSAGPPGQLFPDGRGGYYRVHHVPSQAPNLYTSASPETDVPQSGRKKWHAKESGPRYRTFDSTSGAGNFGMLRTETPFPMAPQPDVLGPRHAATSGFGVLRLGKEQKPRPKTSKAPKAANEAQQPVSTQKNGQPGGPQRPKKPQRPANPPNAVRPGPQPASTARVHPRPIAPMQRNTAKGIDTVDPTIAVPTLESPFPSDTTQAPPPPRATSESSDGPALGAMSVDVAPQDEGNDGDVSDTDTPATATRYTDVDDNPLGQDNGPYFLSNLPPQTSPVQHMHAQAHMRVPSSSPPLPTPVSHIAAKSRVPRAIRSTRKDVLRPPGPGEVARMQVPEAGPYATPKSTSYGTPVRAAVERIKRRRPPTKTVQGRQQAMKQAMVVDTDDGSEDELAL